MSELAIMIEDSREDCPRRPANLDPKGGDGVKRTPKQSVAPATPTTANEKSPKEVATVPRAAATLIYVPGLGHDKLNSAEVVARSLAGTGSEYGAALTVSVDKLPAATAGLTVVATITRGDVRLLDVAELDYREALEALARSGDAEGKEGVAPSLLVQGLYALRGLGLSIAAWRRKSKSPAAKVQLFLGTAGAVALFGTFLLTLVSFVTTLLMAWDIEVPKWLSSSAPWVALSGGVVSAATLAGLRRSMFRAGRRVRQLLRYFYEEQKRNSFSAQLRRAVDTLRESDYDGDIHVVAYSFGSVVALDTFTHDGPQGIPVPDGVAGATSLVTIGCPHDFVRLFLPKHYDGRRAHRAELPWANVFVASDVFGSNFCADKSDTYADQSTEFDMTVTNHRHLPQEELTWWRVVLGIGLRRHNAYWDETDGCWVPLLAGWGLTQR